MEKTQDSNPSKNEGREADDAATASTLINAVIQSLEEEYESMLDPFERYNIYVRIQLFKSIKDFPGRFLDGYDAIINELDH